MLEKPMETNLVKIVGKTCTEKEYSHEMFGEKFYSIYVEIPRLSQSVDILPVTISERLLINLDLTLGQYVIIEGQLRSYNKYIDSANRLILTVFAREIYIPTEEELEEAKRRPNEIFLDGYICKKPVYRVTPFGREITDLLVAVNRAYNKSDYIPCIAWGRNARFCESLIVGDHIKLWGRIQSREYQKKLNDKEVENKVAYEVSISRLEFIEDDNNRVGADREEG
ncbi:MAG TPA: single-stranded DNA-binding protein [Tissierellaceae bacterium]|nr:single-stranded DNA-binding protein [Tissierellaceae bacterium]